MRGLEGKESEQKKKEEKKNNEVKIFGGDKVEFEEGGALRSSMSLLSTSPRPARRGTLQASRRSPSSVDGKIRASLGPSHRNRDSSGTAEAEKTRTKGASPCIDDGRVFSSLSPLPLPPRAFFFESRRAFEGLAVFVLLFQARERQDHGR